MMAVGWSGADPIGFTDPGATYELGTRYSVSRNITISAIRVWAPATSTAMANRKGRVWLQAGSQILSIVNLPDSIPPGWNIYALTSPVDVNSGDVIWITYDAFQNYGATTGVTYPVISSDGSVTATAGAFGLVLSAIPGTTGTNFYGIDFVFSIRTASAPPVVHASVSSNSNRVVGLTTTITDESPGTVLCTIEWGDGNTSFASGPATTNHTYTADGTYAISVLAVDVDGNSDATAVAVTVQANSTSFLSSAAEAVHNALKAAFVSSTSPPELWQLTVGEEVAADADAFTDACCKGLGVTLIPQAAMEVRTSQQDGGSLYMRMTVTLLVFRCAPTLDDAGRVPTEADHLTFTRTVLDDIQRMLQTVWAVSEFSWITEQDISDPEAVAIPVDGGCGGSMVTFEMAVIGDC